MIPLMLCYLMPSTFLNLGRVVEFSFCAGFPFRFLPHYMLFYTLLESLFEGPRSVHLCESFLPKAVFLRACYEPGTVLGARVQQ